MNTTKDRQYRTNASIAFVTVSLVTAMIIFLFWPSGGGFSAPLLVFSTGALAVAYNHVRDGGLLQPIFFIIVSYMVGTVLKLTYATLIDNQYVDYNLLLGERIDILEGGVFVVSFSMILVAVGYTAFKGRGIRLVNREIITTLSNRKTTFICGITLLLSLVALVAYLFLTGFSPSDISGKRFTSEDGANPSARFADPNYYLFRVALLAKIPLYLLLAQILNNNRFDITKSRAPLFLLFIALLLVAFTSFYFSNRILIVTTVTDMVVISYMFTRRVNMKLVYSLAIFASLIFLVASNLRADSTVSKSILDHIFAGRYLLDVTKAAHFYDYFERYGNSLLAALQQSSSFLNFFLNYADLGRSAGQTIFGLRASGVPFGFVIELFALGGYIALGLGSFFLGVVLRQIAVRLSQPKISDFKLLVCALLTVRLTIFLTNGGIGSTAFQTFLDLAPLLFIALLTSSKRSHTHTKRRRAVSR